MRVNEVFFTLTEAATELDVERHTLWRWIKAGKLDAQKIGNVVLIEKRLIKNVKRKGLVKA